MRFSSSFGLGGFGTLRMSLVAQASKGFIVIDLLIVVECTPALGFFNLLLGANELTSSPILY